MGSTTALWMGLMHAHIPDDVLKKDVQTFLHKNAGDYATIDKIQIKCTFFKKAEVHLKNPCVYVSKTILAPQAKSAQNGLQGIVEGKIFDSHSLATASIKNVRPKEHVSH